MDHVRTFFRFLWSHKLKFLLAFISTGVFLFVMFPFSDLSDRLGADVAKLTNGQVYLQLDSLNLGLFPSPFVGAENISVETPFLPGAISAQHLEVLPSLSSVLWQKPSGKLIAKGLFRGDVEIELKPGKKTEAGVATHLVMLKAQSLSLAEIHKVAQLPMLLKGKLHISTSGTADPTFAEQPDFDIDLRVDQLEIPPWTFNSAMGPLNLPELRLSGVEIKGRLSAGKLSIEKGMIGKPTDELFGSVKGGISILFNNQGGNVRPILGAYSFEVDLNAKKSFQDKASLYLGFLDAFKTQSGDAARYQFKVNATSPQMPPSIGALH